MSTPTESKPLPMPKRGESGRKVASEARSEAKPSGVNKEDSSSRASRRDASRASRRDESSRASRGDAARSEPRLLNVGYGNMITRLRVVAVVSSQSSASRRLRDDAEQRGMLVDATQGRRTRSILVMDSGHAVMSAVNPETISARIELGEEGLV